MTTAMLTQDEVLRILTETQAVREGHFALPNRMHTNIYYQLPLALRYYNNYRTLCVGLSRVLRLAPEVAAVLPHCSIISPSSGGIPVAFGVREALRADQILWTERDEQGLRFRQFDEVQSGDRCIVVDDLIVTGRTLTELARLIRDRGGKVVAAGVLVDARVEPVDPAGVPVYALTRINTRHMHPDSCPMCKSGQPVVEAEF